MHDGIQLISYIPWINTLPNHTAMTILVSVLLIVLGTVAGAMVNRAMRQSEGALVPSDSITFFNSADIIAEKIYELTELVIGEHDAATYFPIVGTFFLFIFLSNIVGLVPGILPATEDMNTTFALGMTVFFFYNARGFYEHGIGYLKHFFGPLLILSPIMFVIELVSHLVRPFSLAMRLRGNIYGDHLVLEIFNSLVPILLPVLFYGLGVFVAFVQTFVFCLMTMVYISLATVHEEH